MSTRDIVDWSRLEAAIAAGPRRPRVAGASVMAALAGRVPVCAETIAAIAAAVATGFGDRDTPVAIALVGRGHGKIEASRCIAEVVFGDQMHVTFISHDEPLAALAASLRARPQRVVHVSDVDRLQPTVAASILSAIAAGRLPLPGGDAVACRDAVFVLAADSESFAFPGATSISFPPITYHAAATMVRDVAVRGIPVARIVAGVGDLLRRPITSPDIAQATARAVRTHLPPIEAVAALLQVACADHAAIRAALVDGWDFGVVWPAIAAEPVLVSAFAAFVDADVADHGDGRPLPDWYPTLAAAAPDAPWAMRLLARCGAEA